ncbi:hypothetical protein [Cellvibrio japonicus]|uniref:STAS/SEC14 domain-containing protein n=1 Tax=Cellvibrio japonicus (strain Ueda107) TaxID=498211 RepID=B3PBS9_CELJU|nr:hypothetical protein [Cellvibrio japonicus]ACE85061.1 hypothetical protein CJA_1143 [Cellvibrio japonicus Ueda107]
MDYQLVITPQDGYLHVQVEGIGNYENAVAMWKQVIEACNTHGIYNILGEQYLTRTLSTSEAFDYPRLFKEVGITHKYRIAWVDNNPRTRDITEFIRDVLTSRFIGKGKLFKNVDDAKAWLLKK